MDRATREYPLNADAETQLRLLEVQDKDTRLSQLDHKAKTLPDAARLADAEARLARLRDEVVAAETIAGDLAGEQGKAELAVEQVRERSRRDQELLDSGSIGDPKQLQSLQSELVSLAKRQADLEDVELEVMERVEGAQAAVRQLTGQRDDVSAERDALLAEVKAQLAVIADEHGRVGEERASIAGTIPADLLGLYDKIRADHGGVGAAPLHRGRCEGCRMELPPTEIEALRAASPDVIVRCEDCRRILVRTPESGL